MRPKRIILVLDADQDRAGTLRYLFETHGYVGLVAFTEKEVWAQLDDQWPDVIVSTLGFAGGEEPALFGKLWKLDGPRLLVLASTTSLQPKYPFNRVLYGASSSEILECAHMLAQRKRGPRKGFQRNQKPAAPAA